MFSLLFVVPLIFLFCLRCAEKRKRKTSIHHYQFGRWLKIERMTWVRKQSNPTPNNDKRQTEIGISVLVWYSFLSPIRISSIIVFVRLWYFIADDLGNNSFELM